MVCSILALVGFCFSFVTFWRVFGQIWLVFLWLCAWFLVEFGVNSSCDFFCIGLFGFLSRFHRCRFC